MNLKNKQYRFCKDIVLMSSNNRGYELHLRQDDGFYDRIRTYIEAGKVDGQISVTIDEVAVDDKNGSLFDEKSFVLKMNMYVLGDENFCDGYEVTIRNVKLVENGLLMKPYTEGQWKLKSCSIEIPYRTTIEISPLDPK